MKLIFLILLLGITLKNFKESHGQTPLHIAAYLGYIDLVQFLVSLEDPDIGKPDINAKDNAGWTGTSFH